MSRRTLWLFAPLLFAANLLAADNPQWVEVRSPNFVVTTDAGDKRGREVALRFEQMRRAFVALIPKDKLNITAPLQIVAFKNNRELKQVAPLYKGKPVELAGIYFKGEDQNYIALDTSGTDDWRAVFHEYAHFLLNTNLTQTPLWFDEGFADYYSTIKVNKKSFEIGAAPENYGAVLTQYSLMPVERLFSVVHESPEYNENSDRRSIMYAQSWLVVHWIFDKQKRKNVIDYFLKTMQQNMPIAEAVQSSFGMTPKQMDSEIRSFLANNSVQVITIPLPEMESVLYQSRKLQSYEGETIVAEIQLNSRDYLEAAIKRFEKMTQDAPTYAPAFRGLGYGYFRKGDLAAAEKQFQKAANLDSIDPRVYYFVAYSKLRSGQADQPEDLVEMAELLDKAIKLDPSYADAYDLKAHAVARAGNYPEAIKNDLEAVRLAPRVERYQLNLAGYYAANRKFDDARGLWQKLEQSPDENIARMAKGQLEQLENMRNNPLAELAARDPQGHIDPRWRRKSTDNDPDAEKLEAAQNDVQDETPAKPLPIRFARAVLVSSQCQSSGEALLDVTVGAKKIRLKSRDWTKMTVIGADEFNCNWKNKRITLNYKERSATEGDVVSLEVTSP